MLLDSSRGSDLCRRKIDGANLSLFYDENRDQLRAFGRKTELDEKNNLRGAWEWVQKLDKEKVKSVLGSRYLLFGEWLVKHAVPYPEERYHQMYCFDAMDLETGKYLPQEQVMEMVEKLGLTYVPVFYQDRSRTGSRLRRWLVKRRWAESTERAL